jgi:hypothetical protein
MVVELNSNVKSHDNTLIEDRKNFVNYKEVELKKN